MRPRLTIHLCAALALVALGACSTTSSDRYAGAMPETLDPSQVRMLPDNPLEAVRPAEIATTPQS